MRYFIELSYRGTAYNGWQAQAKGASVQQTLEAALTQRLGQPMWVVGSGRTDAGVHARQQFAHLDTDEPLPLTENFLHSLNCLLPDDIAIHQIFPVRPNDHARFSALSRYYQYHISRHKSAFHNGLTYYYRPLLDVDKMNEACQVLTRYTNFKSFAKARADVTHFHCQLDFAYWTWTSADCLTFHIKANRFLWGMVRTLVGTMLAVGQGQLSPDQFEQIILAHDRTTAGRAAPANGLYLMEVAYPAEIGANRAVENGFWPGESL